MSRMLPTDLNKALRVAEEDPSDREDVRVAAFQLNERMLNICRNARINGDQFGCTVEEIKQLVKEHRRVMRMRGVPFPELVVVAFDKVCAIEVVRTDLDWKSVQTMVLNMTKKYSNITPGEVARGIAEAFPQFRPGQNNEVDFSPKLAAGAGLGRRFLS